MSNKGVNFRIRATNETGPALRGVATGLRNVRREMYTGQALGKSWNAGLSENRRMIQQFGFQVGDFATQIAGGQSAMLAFTQQGGQMLQFFGPFGSIMAMAIAILGSFTIALNRSGASLMALAPALALTSDQVRMIADAWAWLGQSLLTVANFVINHLAALMAMGAMVAGFFAGKWVAAFLSARLATIAFAASLTYARVAMGTASVTARVLATGIVMLQGALAALRGVLVTLGIGAIIVAFGFLFEALMRVSKGLGGMGAMFAAVKDLAVASFKHIIAEGRVLWAALDLVANAIVAAFLTGFSVIGDAWDTLVNGMIQGWNWLASTGAGQKMGFEATDWVSGVGAGAREIADDLVTGSIGRLKGAMDDLNGATQNVKGSWDKLVGAWRKGGSAIDLGTMFGGKGAGGAGGGSGGSNPLGELSEVEQEIRKTFEGMRDAISDSIMSSFKSLLKGTKSIGEALTDILGSILDKIIDIIAQPIFNSVAGSITSGIFSSLGMSLPSFAGGGFTWSGPRSGGVDGKGGRLALLHSDETVTDHRTGTGGSGTTVYMTVNTPDAASFRASQRQIMAQVRGAAK